MGRIESGLLRINDKIRVLPSNHESSISEIRIGDKLLNEATFEQSVTVSLHDEIDVSRGDMIVHKNDALSAIKSFNATICWLSETDLTPNRTYLIMHTSRTSKAKIAIFALEVLEVCIIKYVLFGVKSVSDNQHIVALKLFIADNASFLWTIISPRETSISS